MHVPTSRWVIQFIFIMVGAWQRRWRGVFEWVESPSEKSAVAPSLDYLG